MAKSKYKRILLKLSGEALMDPKEKFGLNLPIIKKLAEEIKEVHDLGVEISIVLGGGNIFRGARQEEFGMDRSTGDYMGMLATVINSMALQNALEMTGVFTRVLSALQIHQVAEPYIKRRALRHLEKGRVIIFAGGTGNPFFSTDTAAALKANDIHAEVLLKGTKVDGIYDADPKIKKNAKRYDSLTYLDCLKNNLKVMDATAISMCMENDMPLIVFNMFEKGNFKKVVLGEKIGTDVYGKHR